MEISQIVTTFLNLVRGLTTRPSAPPVHILGVDDYRVKIVNGQVVEGSFEELVRRLMSKDIGRLERMKYSHQRLASLPLLGTTHRIMVELIDRAIELKKTQQIAAKETPTWLILGLILLIAYAVAGK